MTTNWAEYIAALKRHGSLTIWFDPQMAWKAAPSGKRGRQQAYSDAAFRWRLQDMSDPEGGFRDGPAPDDRVCGARYTAYFLKLAGLDWPVPDFSTLSRCDHTAA